MITIRRVYYTKDDTYVCNNGSAIDRGIEQIIFFSSVILDIIVILSTDD